MGDIYFFLVFFTAILGFIVSGILVFVNKTDTFTSRLLAGFMFFFSLFAMHYTLLTTDFFLTAPHLWKVFVWVSFLYMPISYVYVRSVLTQSFRFKRRDFLLLLPGLIYFASLFPFYLLPASEKLAHINFMQAHPELIPLEQESIFPDGTGFLLRVSLGLGCVAGQYYQLFKWRNRVSGMLGKYEQNKDIYRWLFRFTSISAAFWIMVLLQFFLINMLAGSSNIILISTIIGTILFVCLYLLFRPSILYGIRGWYEAPAAIPAASLDAPEAEAPVLPEKRKTFLSHEQGMLMKKALESHFQEKKPYLKTGYTITNLSNEINVPSYQISSFINQEYGKNFNELVNEYRVKHLVSNFRDSDAYSQYTLEAIGKEVGFNSRAAFIAAVRKVTGKTPSEILGRRLKSGREEEN